MSDRVELLDDFLKQAGWDKAHRSQIAGDASKRRYERLRQDTDETAILMDADPEAGEDVRPFVSMATFLLNQNLSAPRILQQNAQHGFLILEDLGEGIFARLLDDNPSREMELYEAAADVLLSLHHAKPPTLESATSGGFAAMIAPVFEWFMPAIGASCTASERRSFEGALESLLEPILSKPQVVALRDYHTENLLWLPRRKGIARVGLLDFQDALLCHPAYDLVSILQDARRDVSPAVQAAVLQRYVSASGQNPREFEEAYAILGLQRNLRILGIFAKLSLQEGRKHYVVFYSAGLGSRTHQPLQPRAGTRQNVLAGPLASTSS